jgi:hypothetical protein
MAETAAQTPLRRPSHSVASEPIECAFSIAYFGKYGEGEEDVAAPTLSMAISEAVACIARGEGHSRAVFGARRMRKGRRSYGCFEAIFPDQDERPTDGYAEWGVRRSVSFDEAIEIFDALEEFDDSQGALRFRAWDLGDDEKSIALIRDGVRDYVQAFDNAALWDPKASTDIEAGLDELFQSRDWTQFVTRGALKLPEVTISNVELLPYNDELSLVRFNFVNGTDVGM